VPSDRQIDSTPRQRRRAVDASEATGQLVIAFLLLALTVVRYGHGIGWNWR
jgi:hypothetical protein